MDEGQMTLGIMGSYSATLALLAVALFALLMQGIAWAVESLNFSLGVNLSTLTTGVIVNVVYYGSVLALGFFLS